MLLLISSTGNHHTAIGIREKIISTSRDSICINSILYCQHQTPNLQTKQKENDEKQQQTRFGKKEKI